MKSFFLFMSMLIIEVGGMLLIQFLCPINMYITNFAIAGILLLAIFLLYMYIIDKTLIPKIKKVLLITFMTIITTVLFYLVFKYAVKRELNTFAVLYFATTSMVANFFHKYIYAPKK